MSLLEDVEEFYNIKMVSVNPEINCILRGNIHHNRSIDQNKERHITWSNE